MWKSLCGLLRKRTPPDRTMVEFEDSLLLIVDAEQLTNNLCGKLKQAMDVERAVVYLADAGETSPGFKPVRSAAESLEGFPDIPAGGKTANWFRVNRQVLPLEPGNPVTEYVRDELQAFLDEGLSLAFPLISMDRLIGLVFLRLGRTPVGAPELGSLHLLSRQAGLAFENALLFRDRLRQNERMYRAEQLAAIGQFAAGIAHELRNPLTAIRSTIQLFSGEFEEDTENRKLADGILDEVDRLNAIVGDLLSLAHPAQNRPVQIDIRQEIEKCVSLVEAKAHSQSTEIQTTCGDRLPLLFFDPAQLRQVLLNVVVNGLQAMAKGGVLNIRASRLGEAGAHSSSRDARVLVEITDSGPGVPPELRRRVFEPFFTTKPGGTGLGLAICSSIVKQYGGDIWIEPAPSGGACVKIVLPSG